MFLKVLVCFFFFFQWIRESTNEFFQSIVWNYFLILAPLGCEYFFAKKAKFSLLPF